MEKIHKPESRPWILPGKVKVGDLVQMWAANCIESELNVNAANVGQHAKHELLDDDQLLAMLDSEVTPASLDCEGQSHELYVAYEKTLDVPDGVPLETLRRQRTHVKRYASDRSYKAATLQALRYRHHLIRVEDRPKIVGENIAPISTPEAVLTVQIFGPIRSNTHFGDTHKYSFVCDQELNVLSSQLLTKLRDALTCVSDISNPSDCSDEPYEAVNSSAIDTYKAGFFFINNTFYNDTRHTSRDYSKVIIDWAKQRGRGIGKLRAARMEDTTFLDLELQLGYPYLYQHQGDCEHVLVFSDICLLNPGADSTDAADYPKIMRTNRRTKIRCGLCDLQTAKWITLDNTRLPYNPFFFCEPCYFMFNYDSRGQKIGEFRAYPYVDKSAFL